MNMMGHNSAAYGEELRAQVEMVLSDDHETAFHYAQWHVNDYIAGTGGMQLEIEGAYIRFLMRLYQRGKPLPDNDGVMSSLMGLTTRVWRRVKTALIEFGKIICRNGGLTNSRFEKERQRRAEEIKKRSEAATARWQKQAQKKAEATGLSPLNSPNNLNAIEFVSEFDLKKLNEINEAPIKEHMLTNNQYPIREEESPNGLLSIAPQCDLPETRASKPEYPDDFLEFWKIYPRRDGKGAALKAWKKLTLPQKRRAWVSAKRDAEQLRARGQYCPMPATWLNERRFDDDPVQAEPVDGVENVADKYRKFYQNIL